MNQSVVEEYRRPPPAEREGWQWVVDMASHRVVRVPSSAPLGPAGARLSLPGGGPWPEAAGPKCGPREAPGAVGMSRTS